MVRQREGLEHAPRLMLINDADTQARWWMRVKDEWIAAQAQGRPFRQSARTQDPSLAQLRWSGTRR